LGSVPQHCDTRQLGDGFFEQFQPLTAYLGQKECEPCDVPTWTSKAVDESERNGVGNQYHHDRNRRGSLLRSLGRGRSRCHDEVHLETDKLRHKGTKPLFVSIRPSVLNDDVLPLHIAVFAKALPESLDIDFWSFLGP